MRRKKERWIEKKRRKGKERKGEKKTANVN